MLITRKSPKLGNYLHYFHEAEARDGGKEQVLVGHRQIQIGIEEVSGEPIFGDEPIYVDGDDLFVADWEEGWGAPPSDQELESWEEPEPEPTPPDIGRIFADAYETAPKVLNQLKKAVWDYRVGIGTDPNQATAEGVALVLRFGPQLGAYKDAGGHPLAAQALYEAVSSEASVIALPWLTPAILEIFESFLVP